MQELVCDTKSFDINGDDCAVKEMTNETVRQKLVSHAYLVFKNIHCFDQPALEISYKGYCIIGFRWE